MTIIIITKYWKNSDGGGIKTYLTNLHQELEKNNLNVSVIFNQGSDPSNYQVAGSRFLFPILAFFILAKIKPQVIHSQGTWYCLLPGVLYKKIYSCKLIDTFRSEPKGNLPKLFKILYQYLVNSCDSVTFVSIGLKEKIEETYGLRFKDTQITYPGVRLRDVSETEIEHFKKQFNIRDNTILLLVQAFTANSLKAEGLKIVIKSIKELRDKYPNIKLIVTRKGHYSNELQEFARKEGVSDSIIFTGNLENPFVPLTICNIFLFPWLGKSGVGNALLEAMCVGKPIIATSVNGSGVSEIITDGENGILVEADPIKIADKIEYLVNYEEFAHNIGKNAKEKVESDFTWEKVARNFELIYLSK